MPETRPAITPSLTLSEFLSWYWLKAELMVFCRILGLTTTGSKQELEEKIRRHLSGGELKIAAKRRANGEMPTKFTPQTVIGEGWRCNPALGAYFRKACGNGFRFNAIMRDFIHSGAGQTLADAAVRYRASVAPDSPRTPIPGQLKYNQHFRDFFAAQPTATRQQAIAAWWERRSRRNGTRVRAE